MAAPGTVYFFPLLLQFTKIDVDCLKVVFLWLSVMDMDAGNGVVSPVSVLLLIALSWLRLVDLTTSDCCLVG